jgi:hypothetical protein
MQLNNAMNIITTDSLLTVYTDVAIRLDLAKKELTEKALKGIPDSDISLKSIDQKQKTITRVLQDLKTIRNKKIVHL